MSEEQATPTESATDTPTETTAPPSVTESVAEPTRPEGLPEKFNTWEDMAKSYSEMESWKGKKTEDIKAEVLQELETEAYSNRPATSGDYQIPEVLDEGELQLTLFLNGGQIILGRMAYHKMSSMKE